MDNLDFIEAAHGGPFRYLYHGATRTLESPVDMPFQRILAALQLEGLPGLEIRMPTWQRDLLFRRWVAHYDLPPFQEAQRLAYLIDHYRSAIVYDLRAFLDQDLGELWRARRWRTLLDYIDHLPAHSWYSASVSTDEEHARMIAESLAARKAAGDADLPDGPPMQTWTPEVAALTALRDDVRALHFLIPASAGDRTAKAPEPLPRPYSPLEGAMKRANHQTRQKKHNSLVSRMLPHKA